MRQHGSPDLTYTDFVVVQSTWGMTQGFIMPLSGFLINAIGQKVIVTEIVSLWWRCHALYSLRMMLLSNTV